MIDIESNVVQALYDIRDPQRWNLKRLAGILQQKSLNTRGCLLRLY